LRATLCEKLKSFPLVMFADEVAQAIGVSRLRFARLVAEGASPIPELPFYGLLQRTHRRGRKRVSEEARPCWAKARVIEFLLKPDWHQATALELPSEVTARTCTGCPVHCPSHHEHSYSRYRRNGWRSGR
jgi:hypothetical protein